MENGRGDADAWTLISEGTIALPTDRQVPGEAIMFDNDDEYTSYKIVFTDTRTAAASSVQLADFRLIGVPEPTAAGLLLIGAAGLLRRRQVR